MTDRRLSIRREIPVSTADNTDIARFSLPPLAEAQVYNLRFISDGLPNYGSAVSVELVDSANTVLAEVNASGPILSSVAEANLSSGLRLVNSSATEFKIYKLRTNGIFITPGKGTVELDMDDPGAN